jgi:MYXO-CTERM domain-containing protein
VNARYSALGAWMLCLGAACGGDAPVQAPALGKSAAALSGTVLWELQTPSVAPPPRMAHAFVYDPVRQLSIAAGGMPVNDTGNSLSDTWSWDGQSWAFQAAGLPNRGYVAGAFDFNRQVTVLYGGVDEPQFQPRRYFAEALERSTGTWIQGSGTPGARGTAGLTYDASRGVTVLFGGWTGSAWLDDIWEYDGTSWSRRCTTAPCSTGLRPARRESPVFVYDAAREVTLLFGGYGDNQYRGDTWTWDGSSWTAHAPGVAPEARTRSAGAYDPATQSIYVFGGATFSEELNDLWAWNGSIWEQVAAAAPPSGRRDLGMAWDSARRRGVLFGGRSSNQAVDFWEFSLVGNDCGSDAECHNGVCGGTVCGDPIPEADAGPDVPDADGSGGVAGTGADAGAAGAGGSGGAPNGAEPDAALGGAGGVSGSAGAGDPGPNRAVSSRESLYSCASSPQHPSSSWPTPLLGLAALIGLWQRRRSAGLGHRGSQRLVGGPFYRGTRRA